MIALKLKSGEEVYLTHHKKSEEGDEIPIYELFDNDSKVWLTLKLVSNRFEVIYTDMELDEPASALQIKLDNLVLQVIEANQSGLEPEDSFFIEEDPYNPDSIKVQTKAFSLSLISDMIDKGFIDLAPDFQRKFVWTPIQKSRLIESILLRIPLPMFYFSEDNEGNISVVDGLQRLTTIKEFMDNKFALKKMEYLKSSCENKYFAELEPKYLKWFFMTQLTVNVIDPASPAKVKYDIFKRINTGGKPLNNQEIRNSLASKNLRAVLSQMVNFDEFKLATDWSIKPTRMEDQEVALRFICFYRLFQEDATLQQYNGNMEAYLDSINEKLSKFRKEDFEIYIQKFLNAMKNSAYLFGKRAFRKNQLKHLEEGAHKQLINKALFLSWSILLSGYDPDRIREKNIPGLLAEPLAKLITEDFELYNFLSYGTNGKANLQAAFKSAQHIIDSNLIY